MKPQELKRIIDDMVDQWVSGVLKARFIEKPAGVKPVSFWDRLKQGASNFFWGPDDRRNTYRWKNRFGQELGASESLSPSLFTLKEYGDIRGLVESVEYNINESDEEFDKLRLMTIIRSAAERLKEMLFRALVGKCSRVAEVSPETRAGTTPHGGGEEGAPASGEREGAAKDAVPPGDTATDEESPSGSATGPAEAGRVSGPPRTGPVSPSNRRTSSGREASADARPSVPRKTDRQKIEEAADKAKDASQSELTPKSDWFGLVSGNIRIKKERIPYLLAWMAMKPHANPLDEEHIMKELNGLGGLRDEIKEKLGGDISLGLPGKGNLRKYLERTLGRGTPTDTYIAFMDKLKIGPEEPNEEEKIQPSQDETGGRDESGAGNSDPDSDLPTSSSESGSESPAPDEFGENDSLKGYLYEGDPDIPAPIKRKPNEIFQLLYDFAIDLAKKRGRKLEVNKWFRKEGERIKENVSVGDRFGYMRAKILSTNEYIDSIAKAVDLDSNSVKNEMRDFLRRVSSGEDPTT